jgi:hypothetical protein
LSWLKAKLRVPDSTPVLGKRKIALGCQQNQSVKTHVHYI